jgi:hypothetical protein
MASRNPSEGQPEGSGLFPPSSQGNVRNHFYSGVRPTSHRLGGPAARKAPAPPRDGAGGFSCAVNTLAVVRSRPGRMLGRGNGYLLPVLPMVCFRVHRTRTRLVRSNFWPGQRHPIRANRPRAGAGMGTPHGGAGAAQSPGARRDLRSSGASPAWAGWVGFTRQPHLFVVSAQEPSLPPCICLWQPPD